MVVFSFLEVECDFLSHERNIVILLAGIKKHWLYFARGGLIIASIL